MRPFACVRLAVAVVAALGVLGPALAQAQPRYYWKTLSGTNVVPLILESVSGNTNPFDPSHTVTPGANFSATLALPGYARMLTVSGRGAMIAVILPMGRIAGDVTVAGRTTGQATAGFGDPMVEFDINVLGPRAQKNIPDALRYEPRISVDLLGDLAFPIGEYDSGQPLNLGQNRWYGRLGAPIVAQVGPWVPGRRTTLECIPAVWLFGTNDDFVGQEMETDPMFQLDAHLTHDFTEHFWGSLDAALYTGGKATIDDAAGEKLNNLGFGLTLGSQINGNLMFTFGYKSTVNDKASDDLRMDVFSVALFTGWHPLIEGAERLKGGE